MKSKIQIKNITDLSLRETVESDIRQKINCITVDCKRVVSQFSSPTYLNALSAILVLSGRGSICINYKSYQIKEDMLLLLSSSHLFYFYDCSEDFKCICLFVSKVYMDDMDTTDMIYKRIRYGVRLYNEPVVALSQANALVIFDRMKRVDKSISYTEHYYYKEVILNSLFAFYLDLSDILERQMTLPGNDSITRYESVIKSFIELLVIHYREEHKVEFYASELNLSSNYLTLIVKQVTGQSVSDFIYEMLYSEARTLLSHSKLSVQEIAAKLNFSDQSSFGKFFKRKSGLSPKEFRKE